MKDKECCANIDDDVLIWTEKNHMKMRYTDFKNETPEDENQKLAWVQRKIKTNDERKVPEAYLVL